MKVIFFCSFLFILAACAKNDDFVVENTTPTGTGYYPISVNTLVDMATNANINNAMYSPGALFRTELQFISQSPIKEINVYSTVGSGAKTKISTVPYAPAHSVAKGTDTLLIAYTVPLGLTAGTAIKLDLEILNVNTLSVTRSATILVR
jgi:hypothetical protein